MKRLVVVILLMFLVSGCVPDIQSILKQQAANCSSHFTGSIGGGMLGTQTGVLSFNIDCQPTGVAPPTTTTGPAVQATKSPQ
jgi:hypothetical protein